MDDFICLFVKDAFVEIRALSMGLSVSIDKRHGNIWAEAREKHQDGGAGVGDGAPKLVIAYRAWEQSRDETRI